MNGRQTSATLSWPPPLVTTMRCVAKSSRCWPPTLRTPASSIGCRLPPGRSGRCYARIADRSDCAARTRCIGPYEIIGLIGAGAMGEVYRARDTKLNRDVALKVLPPLFALDPDRVARFRREAQVLAALNHPNIAAIYGLEESDGVQALVLELVDGPTLADRIARGPLPAGRGARDRDARSPTRSKPRTRRASFIATSSRRTSRSPATASSRCSTSAWRRSGKAHPTLELAASPALTATSIASGRILGTPGYMSPEQARGRALDKRTDIWSFGCVLFEMLTGRAAFAGETISDTIARVLDASPTGRRCLRVPRSASAISCAGVYRRTSSRRLRDIGDARLELDEALTPADAPTAHSAIARSDPLAAVVLHALPPPRRSSRSRSPRPHISRAAATAVSRRPFGS